MAAAVPGPAVLFRRLAPFTLAVALAYVLVAFTARADGSEFAIALGLTAAVVLATVWLPWQRLPGAMRVVPALLFLASIAVLRDAAGGISSGVGVVVLLPVFWAALHGTRAQLAVVLAGVAVFYLVPVVVIGGPAYPASGVRTGVLFVVMSTIVGHTVQQLVRQVRGQSARLERHATDLQRVAQISRRLATSADPRTDVCGAACELSGASFAFLMEPSAGGGLLSTGMVGLDAPVVASGTAADGAPAAVAFTTSGQVFIEDMARYRRKDEALWRSHGAPRSMLFEPVIRDGAAVGVLVMGWADHVPARRRPEIIGLLAAQADFAIEQADLVQELKEQATRDGLTGLLNRRAWDAELERALADPGRQPVCIALLDLDNFKAFNDTRGHQAGDRLLKEAATAWLAVLRPSDVLARYGGEEFAVVLPDCDPEAAIAVLDRLRDAMPGSETCSAGLATWDGSESMHELVGRADRALYDAKATGRDRAVVA